MNIFTLRLRTLALSAVLAVVGAGWVGGCENFGLNSDGNTGSNCTSAETCRQVTIGGVTWMAENLNIKTGNSWCYGDTASYCRKYGRLYDWETAKNACPVGWHLPSTQEWKALAEYVGWDGSKLKARSDWNPGVGAKNGTDDYGFSALPGGYRYGEHSYAKGAWGCCDGWWWTNSIGGYFNDGAYIWYMQSHDDVVQESVASSYDTEKYGYSVRCIAD